MPITTAQTPPIQPERTRCRHIHADGRRCGSPCLRGEAFCYFHHTSRKPIARPEARRSRRSAFDLPLPEDRTSIQLSIGEILRRIALNDVDPRRAGLLLYGLQIASTNLAHTREANPSAPIEQPVEELTVDPALGPLAPPAPFSPTPAGSSKPSLIDMLLERLRTPPGIAGEPGGSRYARWAPAAGASSATHRPPGHRRPRHPSYPSGVCRSARSPAYNSVVRFT